jgi:CBS domain-containing protein
MQVKELMTKSVKTIEAGATLQEAAQMMRELDVGVLPVSNGGKPTGMLTDRDIVVRALADSRDPTQTCVQDIITPRVCSILEDRDVQEAAELMAKEQVRRLLVVDEQRRAVGILSLGDLSRGSAETAAETAMEGVVRPTRYPAQRAHP